MSPPKTDIAWFCAWLFPSSLTLVVFGLLAACCRRVQRDRPQPQGGTGEWRVLGEVRQVGRGQRAGEDLKRRGERIGRGIPRLCCSSPPPFACILIRCVVFVCAWRFQATDTIYTSLLWEKTRFSTLSGKHAFVMSLFLFFLSRSIHNSYTQ